MDAGFAMLAGDQSNMGTPMKTTIELGDSLLAEARRVAAEQGTTLPALVDAGLREVLAQRRQGAKPFRLQRVTMDGEGLQPRLRDASWQQLRDLAHAEPAP